MLCASPTGGLVRVRRTPMPSASGRDDAVDLTLDSEQPLRRAEGRHRRPDR